MNDSSQTRKIVLIVIAILAVAVAAFSIGKTIKGSQPQNMGVLGGGTADPNAPGLKSQLMGGGAEGGKGGGAPAGRVDPSGAPAGAGP